MSARSDDAMEHRFIGRAAGRFSARAFDARSRVGAVARDRGAGANPGRAGIRLRYEPPRRGDEVEQPDRSPGIEPPRRREVEQPPSEPPGFRPGERRREVEQPKRPPHIRPPREDDGERTRRPDED